MTPSFQQLCMDMMLRKHRIISPLCCSAHTSPAWCCNIIALQTPPEPVNFSKSVQTWGREWRKKQRLDEMCWVFLPFSAVFLCVQWLGGALKRKAMTQGNHWAECGCPSASDNWDFAATVCSPWSRPRLALLWKRHRRTPGKKGPSSERGKKKVFMQNYSHRCALGQTLRITGQDQLSLMHIWRAAVAVLSK